MLERSLELILGHEGGYQKHPKDGGNWTGGKAGRGVLVGTRYGISAPAYQAYKKIGAATETQMRNLPLADAIQIYKKNYAAEIKFDKLPAGVNYAVLDYAINSGVNRAVKTMQRVAGVKVDGIIGDVTLEAVNLINPSLFIEAFTAHRLRHVRSLKIYAQFGKGWETRIKQVEKNALKMANDDNELTETALSPAPETGAAKEPIITKESIGWAAGVIGSLGMSFNGNGAIQIAVAVVIVAGFGLVAYSMIRKKVEIV